MDIYCSKCAEPWDNDCIHDEVEARRDNGDNEATYKRVAREFQVKGCMALATAYGLAEGDCEAAPKNDAAFMRALIASAAYEINGDDIDGAASTMEDYFYAHNL